LAQRRVAAQLARITATLPAKPTVVANLGSGGNDFDCAADLHIHIDLVSNRIRNKVAIVADVEQVPLRDASVDFVLCVGGVLNHGDAQKMIGEIARILSAQGLAVIEFDCVDGLHHRPAFPQRDSAVVDTFFNGRRLSFTEYSRAYIERELQSKGLRIEYRYSFHILSALMLRFAVYPSIAAMLVYCDFFARLLEPLRYRGSNLLMVARRI